MRIMAQFSRESGAIYNSHLDVMRAVQRALRRANIPVRYSSGYNPHPQLSFASAMSVGLASTGEIMDVTIDGEFSPEAFCEAMRPQMPPGMDIVCAHTVDDSHPAAMNYTAFAEYTVKVTLFRAVPSQDVGQKLTEFFSHPIMAVKKSKSGAKEIDILPMVHRFEWKEIRHDGDITRFTLDLWTVHAPTGALNPELLMPELMDHLTEGEYEILRLGFYTQRENCPLPLWK